MGISPKRVMVATTRLLNLELTSRDYQLRKKGITQPRFSFRLFPCSFERSKY